MSSPELQSVLICVTASSLQSDIEAELHSLGIQIEDLKPKADDLHIIFKATPDLRARLQSKLPSLSQLFKIDLALLDANILEVVLLIL